MKCRNCKNNTLLDDGVQFSWCEVKKDNLDIDEDRECGAFSQASNADRIRAMSDEELADLLWETVDGAYYQIENFMSQPSKRWWLEWLRMEATE